MLLDFSRFNETEFMRLAPDGSLQSIDWEKCQIVAEEVLQRPASTWSMRDGVAVVAIAVRGHLTAKS